MWSEVCVAAAKDYVRVDECGVKRVGQTRVSLDSVVYAFRGGSSPEAIRNAYPALNLDEVYGAVAYYLARQSEIDAYLKEQQELSARVRQRADAERPPVVDRLRELIRAREAARSGA